jgi:hypothetical protein
MVPMTSAILVLEWGQPYHPIFFEFLRGGSRALNNYPHGWAA